MNDAPSSQFCEPPSPKKALDVDTYPLVSMSEAVRVNLHTLLSSSCFKNDSLGIVKSFPPTWKMRF
jgi:hypothetical protein